MESHSKARIVLVATLAGALALNGCGGGSSVASTPTPTPTPTPSPAPTPTPTPTPTPPPTPTPTPTPTPGPTPDPSINYDTAEYRRSNAATSISAITAYNQGATGAGIKIAVLDSGLADVLGEFTGRIDGASRDVAADRGIVDTSGHGTSVAAVAAAGRNGSDIMGVAFASTLMVLRTDESGSCASADGCAHQDSVLAQAVDLARTNGARVINISLGGEGMGATLRSAIGRATAQNIVVVISAGNDGTADPDAFAQEGAAAGNGLVIVAGSHGATGLVSDFSNKAGASAASYLSALGERVRAFDHTGTAFLYSGTSYAAPVVSGAVALLAHAFPNLTGAQIVSLLYRTADDAGDAGVDGVYGNGLINLTRAFQPVGATSLAGSAVPLSLTFNGQLSPAMGDAAVQTGQVAFLDSYGRAFAVDLGATVRRAAGQTPLAGALARPMRMTGFSAGPLRARMTLSRAWAPGLSQRLLNGEFRLALSDRTTSIMAIGQDIAQNGQAANWLTSADAAYAGLGTDAGMALGLEHRIGSSKLDVAASRGRIGGTAKSGQRAGYRLTSVGLARAVGPLRARVGLSLMQERGSVLGAMLSPTLVPGGADTLLLDVDATMPLNHAWSLHGRWRQGRSGTRIGALGSNAFIIDIVRQGPRDRLGLRMAQPLRVTSSSLVAMLPESYDYATGTARLAPVAIDLAPTGRERSFELAYGRAAAAGWVDTNLFLRRDPGHSSAAANDIGISFRTTMGF